MKSSHHALSRRLSLILLCAALFSLPQVTRAATANWTAGTNGNWNISTNWTIDSGPTQRVPTGTDAAQISAATNYTVTINSAVPNLAQLFIANGGNNHSGTVRIVDGGSVTLTSTGGAINLSNNGGSTGYLKLEGGTLGVSGTGASINIGRSSGSGYFYISGGQLSASGADLNVANTNGGSGYVYQSAGNVSLRNIAIDPSTSANSALYEISGGSLSVASTLTNGAAASGDNGQLRVIGSTATISVAGSSAGAYTQRSGSTLEFRLDNGGVSKINLTSVSASAVLAGTLKTSFKAGAALLSQGAFRLIEAETISGDFGTKPSSTLWTTAIQTNIDGGTRDAYVLSLNASASVGTLLLSGDDVSFSSRSSGYATISGISLDAPVILYLNAFAGSGTTQGLIDYFNANGLVAAATSLDGFNIALTFATPVATTSEFAWDLSSFNATATLSGLQAVPEPSVAALFVCALVLLAKWRIASRRMQGQSAH